MRKILVIVALMASFVFGANIPEFNIKTITGEMVSKDDYLSSMKPTLFYFSASWCPTCAKNWPILEKLSKEYDGKFNLVSVSIDASDTDEVLQKLAKKHKLTYPMVAGNPELMRAFGVSSQATTVVADKNGKIVFKKSGNISLKEYKKIIDDAIMNVDNAMMNQEKIYE